MSVGHVGGVLAPEGELTSRIDFEREKDRYVLIGALLRKQILIVWDEVNVVDIVAGKGGRVARRWAVSCKDSKF